MSSINSLKVSQGKCSESPDSAVNHNTNQGGAGPHGIGRGDESRVGLLLRQKLKMDNKSIKRPGGAEKHRGKKLKSLEVEAAKCAKLTDLFGAGFTSPAAAGAPGDERGGLDNDERVEADMLSNASHSMQGDVIRRIQGVLEARVSEVGTMGVGGCVGGGCCLHLRKNHAVQCRATWLPSTLLCVGVAQADVKNVSKDSSEEFEHQSVNV
ncbi:unnamed protein product [Pleuronectes platessa]|uniref:Uncharacterized protein n=1 Tax=Pleuronectes platessa TaxID=8262 RepID=A0A9N7Z078_PLEPL|nr:unnamed protein product [Pleuronectes platessa]